MVLGEPCDRSKLTNDSSAEKAWVCGLWSLCCERCEREGRKVGVNFQLAERTFQAATKRQLRPLGEHRSLQLAECLEEHDH